MLLLNLATALVLLLSACADTQEKAMEEIGK